MTILDILRKSGIFRYGSRVAKYKNAKERPIEFQSDGVFNSKKDLSNDEITKVIRRFSRKTKAKK